MIYDSIQMEVFLGASFPLFMHGPSAYFYLCAIMDFHLFFSSLLYDLGLYVLYLSVIRQVPNLSCLIFVTNSSNMIQVLEIGSVGKGISQGHPLFYAHSSRVTIL
jgi:hypothetical protein